MKEFDDFMDLTGEGRTLKCFYHGTHDPYLEGRIFEEKDSNLVVGVSLWEDDIHAHTYDPVRYSLDIWYKAPDPDEYRIALLVIQEFTVPKDIREINIYDADVKG